MNKKTIITILLGGCQQDTTACRQERHLGEERGIDSPTE